MSLNTKYDRRLVLPIALVLGPLRQLTGLTDATNITALILLGAMDHVKYTLQGCKRQLKSPIIATGVNNALCVNPVTRVSNGFGAVQI